MVATSPLLLSRYHYSFLCRQMCVSTTEEADIGQILLEARSRWLKPAEVCNILRNFKAYEFQLNNEPPVKPPGEE